MIWLFLLVTGLHAAPVAASAANVTHSTLLYRHFFPGWNSFIQGYLEGECRSQLANYRNATFSDPRVSYTVLDCLLKQFPEFRKAEMSTAAVVLGLAPTILQMISPRPSDTAMVALRRPFLALLLSVAAPATTCPPPGTYSEKLKALSKRLPPQVNGCFPYTVPRTLGYYGWMAWLVSALQYAVALGAVANSAYRTYQLCIWTVCTIVPTRVYLPAVWHASVVVLHLVGWLAMVLSLRRTATTTTTTRTRTGSAQQSRRSRSWKGIKRMLGSEAMPGAFAKKMPVESRDSPAPFFSVMTMGLYVGVPVHILYGTLVLSSLTFISALDAVGIVAWYVLSAILCKAVVYFECAGIQAVASASLLAAAPPPPPQMNGHVVP